MVSARVVIKGQNFKPLVTWLKVRHAKDSEGSQLQITPSGQVVVFADETHHFGADWVLSSVVLDFSQENICHISIMCGGGRTMDWGAGGAARDEYFRTIQNICQDNDWEFEGTKSSP